MRRLFGLDRSGPPPRQTEKGEPLHPWTIPNLVGYLRLAAIPLFLFLAFESGDGRTAAAAIVFWLIAAGDYLDGFLARVTGQYSRLGTLLDPLHRPPHDPRRRRRLLALRAAAALGAGAAGGARGRRCSSSPSTALRHGVEIRVNWPGRISVFPIMGGIFFALVFDGWVPDSAADPRRRPGDRRDGALRADRPAGGAGAQDGAHSG